MRDGVGNSGHFWFFLIPVGVVGAFMAAALGTEERSLDSESYPFVFVFKEKCASCHGSDGQGVNDMYEKLELKKGALNLTRTEIIKKSDEELESSIRLGKGKMPSFDKKFHDDVIYGLARYVKSLGQTIEEVRKSETMNGDLLGAGRR